MKVLDRHIHYVYTLDVKRTTIFLPEDLIARLDAEAARSRVKPAELIRRCIDSVIPLVESSPGELRNRIDKDGLLKVFVLDARAGRLLVEPGDGGVGLFEPLVQLWVPADLVMFSGSAESLPHRNAQSTPPTTGEVSKS